MGLCCKISGLTSASKLCEQDVFVDWGPAQLRASFVGTGRSAFIFKLEASSVDTCGEVLVSHGHVREHCLRGLGCVSITAMAKQTLAKVTSLNLQGSCFQRLGSRVHKYMVIESLGQQIYLSSTQLVSCAA